MILKHVVLVNLLYTIIFYFSKQKTALIKDTKCSKYSFSISNVRNGNKSQNILSFANKNNSHSFCYNYLTIFNVLLHLQKCHHWGINWLTHNHFFRHNKQCILFILCIYMYWNSYISFEHSLYLCQFSFLKFLPSIYRYHLRVYNSMR